MTGPAGESPFKQEPAEFFVAVAICGKFREGLTDQGSPNRIGCDPVQVVTVASFQGVEVADRCSAHRAPSLDLALHLARDVRPIAGRAVLVDCGQQAVGELANGCLVDVFSSADERDMVRRELGCNRDVIRSVTCQAGEVVHNDMTDVGTLSPLEQALELWSGGDAGARAPRLDVLGGDGESMLLGGPLTGVSLGGDRESLRTYVTAQLPGSADAQIGECS